MKIFFPLLLLVFIVSCQKESQSSSNNSNNNAIPEQTLLNVSYGSDVQQKMDMYLPGGRTTTSTKVMIMIHGGGWSSGDKTDFTQYFDTLKKRLPDYAIFNINYRLATIISNPFPAQENDVKAAFDYIVSKAGDYKISPKIVLLGASAGAHLALLQGYKYSSPVSAKAIIDFFGPTDLVELHNHPADPSVVTILEILLAGTPSSNAAMYQQSGPINFVNAQSPPTLILQGGIDPLVPVAQATSLDAKLQTAGVAHQYIYYPTEGHGWIGTNLTHSFNAIQAFLAANVN